MKKNLLKIFLLLVVFSFANMTLSAMSNVGLYSKTNKVTILEDYLQDKEYTKQMEVYLKNKYGTNYKEYLQNNTIAAINADKINATFEKSKNGDVIYPEFFGGMYIDNNNKLVIQVVEKENAMSKSNLSLYKEILKVDENITTTTVNYTYGELEKVYNSLNDYYLNSNNNYNISSFYIDVINNRVVVELKEYTEQSVDELKNKITTSSILHFLEAEKEVVNYADLLAGSGYSYLNKQCSFGYRARVGIGLNVGMVTAGHCVYANGNEIKGIGTVGNRQVSGSIDAAFVLTNSGVTPSNTFSQNVNAMRNYLSPNETMSSFTVGTIVGKIGISTGYSTGKITSTNYSFQGITQLVKTDVYGQGGDSGGVVFNHSIGLNGYRLAGIVQGGTSTGGDMQFTRADKINSAFNINRY